jgi:uncharacterized membrane protein (UPF0127 family)
MIFKQRSISVLILTLLVSLSCGAETGRIKKFEKRELLIETAEGGSITVAAEIARTDKERSQGLMYRKTLADGTGMLFIFEKDQILSFWMKNTLIPLSIAFIAYNGKILEIRDMEAGDLRSIQSSRSARYALEAPRGWFGRAGIKPGDFLRLEDW